MCRITPYANQTTKRKLLISDRKKSSLLLYGRTLARIVKYKDETTVAIDNVRILPFSSKFNEKVDETSKEKLTHSINDIPM